PARRAILGSGCEWMILQNMAVVMSRSGRLEEAAGYATRAIGLLDARLPRMSLALMRPLQTLSTVRLQQGRIGEARTAYQRMQGLPSNEPLDRALVHGTAAALFQAEGRNAEAEAEY